MDNLQNNKCSIVTEGTIINGNIQSKLPVVIIGEVVGDVVSESDVEVIGSINGNINGLNVVLNGGKVNGDIIAEKNIESDSNSSIFGNINCNDLTSSGTIKGRIEVTKLITLDTSAICEGEISASLINIKTGARIKGPITIYENEEVVKEAKKTKN